MVQVVVPMAGFGERFRRAGYRIPKPLIRVDGRPMVAHAVAPFPEESDVFFVCNKNHLSDRDLAMEATLRRAHPGAQVIGIDGHNFGPSFSVNQILPYLNQELPVIVNYCDFSSSLTWEALERHVSSESSQGVIVCYRGFHPHSLRSTNYAYVKEEDGYVQDVQEKRSFTRKPTEEYASSGTYFFASASLLSHALENQFKRNLAVKGEFYVSLAFKYLIENELRVSVLPVKHFAQWGTPEDLADYRVWSGAFNALSRAETPPEQPAGKLLLTMAGKGERFRSAGYRMAKPFISVAGAPMFVHGINTLPPAEKTVLIAQARDIEANKKSLNPHLQRNTTVVSLETWLPGQAASAVAGLEQTSMDGPEELAPLVVSAADCGYQYCRDFNVYGLDEQTDILVWGFRGHPRAKRLPTEYSWILERRGVINQILVKDSPDDPNTAMMVTGTFVFRNQELFWRAYRHLESAGLKNGAELSMDQLVNSGLELGFRCEVFEADHFYCWGTPEELKVFEYWSAFFGSDSSHPYSPDLDILSAKLL